jgi:hypothetical protein
MSILGDDDSLLGSTPSGSENNYVASLGRISGKLLSDNLLRNGTDLAFNTDLLYLEVTNRKIGINTDAPIYDVDAGDIRSSDLRIINELIIDDIKLTAPNTISSIIAPIEIFIDGPTLFHDRVITDFLEFDDNFIGSFSNSNIVLDPNGVGTVEIFSTTNITGLLAVSGNITVPGNLRLDGIIVLGDNPFEDTVTIAPDLTQSIIPGDNLLYDLGSISKRWRSGFVDDVGVLTGFTAGNITVAAPSTVSVSAGNININILGANPTANFTGDVHVSSLKIDGNTIQSFNNQNIVFNANGTGPIRLESNTAVAGNLGITGNTIMTGNLSFQGTITIGDQTIDTVTIAPDFTQSIVPGDDLLYALGADAADSSPRRWAQLHFSDWTNISTGVWPGSGLRSVSVNISDQMSLDGIVNKISTTRSNEDIVLNPNSGITFVESTKWENDYITNLLNTPIVFAGTGRGYVQFNGSNGIVFPAGDISQRRSTPEIGESRWNTELAYLEVWTGAAWVISTGGGEEVTIPIMDDISNVWQLILG